MPQAFATLSAAELVTALAIFFASLTISNVLFGFAAERLFPQRRVMALPLPKGQLRHELWGNLRFVVVCIVSFSAVLLWGWVRFGEGGWLLHVATFLLLMFGFQVFYYFLHRAMHHRWFARFHAWHHKSQVTTALSAQSMSSVEACAWMIGYVGLPLALSQVWPISFWGWASYIAFNISGNIVGHANVELGSPASGHRALSMFANPWVYHALHHARWTGHYGFQAALMDRLFGTEFSDWPALLRRIIGGEPMHSLKERGDVAPRPGVTDFE